jgi:hypothetical protein
MGCVSERTGVGADSLDVNPGCLCRFWIFSLIMHVYFAYNVILTHLTVVMVSNIMGCVSGRTGVGADGLDVNPGRLRLFSNIFINYAGLHSFQCNINSFNCHNNF